MNWQDWKVFEISDVFFVPCYGFGKAKVGDDIPDVMVRVPDDEALGVLENSDRVYIPIMGRHDALSVDMIDEYRSNQRLHTTLRSRSTPKPEYAYNVALAIEGPRTFRDVEGYDSDCYVVWGKNEAESIDRVVASSPSENLDVFAIRHGRAVIYTRIPRYDSREELCGLRTVAMLVEISIFDRKPDLDDMMRVQITVCDTYSDDPDVWEEPEDDDLDDVWRSLIDRARIGFETHCRVFEDEDEYSEADGSADTR